MVTERRGNDGLGTNIIEPERGVRGEVGHSSGVDRVVQTARTIAGRQGEEVTRGGEGSIGGRGFYDPQSEVNRLFDEMLGGLGNTGRRQQRAPQTQWAPALDVVHEDGDLLIRAELPGVKREDVEITFHE